MAWRLLDTKHLHHFVPAVIDHLHCNPAGLRLLDALYGADEEALFTIVGVDEPAASMLSLRHRGGTLRRGASAQRATCWPSVIAQRLGGLAWVVSTIYLHRICCAVKSWLSILEASFILVYNSEPMRFSDGTEAVSFRDVGELA